MNDDKQALYLPKPAIKLAARVSQLLETCELATITIVVIDGVWYLATQSGRLEQLG